MKSMKTYLSRIAVGSERLININGTCPGCGMQKGELHKFGCGMEECPSCRKTLVGCPCDRLVPHDSAKIISALYTEFTSIESAVAVVSGNDSRPESKASYLTHAAMLYLYQHMPEDVRAELNKNFQERHPGLIPLLQDENGYGYYTAEQLSAALGIPLGEVNEKIEAMVTAGQGIRFGDGVRLNKVH